MMNKYVLLLVGSLILLNSCKPTETKAPVGPPSNDKRFTDYWFQGKAEITHYDLDQARYGEIRKGDAVLVFVTEDFVTSKQVKLEDYSKGTNGSTPVLKLNGTKTFITGIYPYTMMQSVFSPVDLKTYPHALKITSTVLEWCGQVFTQINNVDNGFKVKIFSYFEKEGDEEFLLNKTFLEDEIWTQIRLAPEQLPVGDVKIIPGTLASRLRHTPLAVETAQTAFRSNSDTTFYTIDYESSERTLTIAFKTEFPHEIFSWQETYKDGFGDRARVLTTKAVRKKSILLDYWNKHAVADSVYRKELGLN